MEVLSSCRRRTVAGIQSLVRKTEYMVRIYCTEKSCCLLDCCCSDGCSDLRGGGLLELVAHVAEVVGGCGVVDMVVVGIVVRVV